MKPAKKVQKEKTGPKSEQEEEKYENTGDVRPKNARTAYTFFLIEKRPEISKQYKGKEIMKKIGSMWKACSDAEKKPYITLAEKDKERYEWEIEEFKKSREFNSEIGNVIKGAKPMKRRIMSPRESTGAKRKANDNKKCRCFKQSCEFEVQYVCLCLCDETYSCESHFEEHLKLPNRNHSFDSILEEPCEWTKAGILRFLEKEKSKKEKLKMIAVNFYQKYRNIDRIEESLRDLYSDIKETRSLIEKFYWVLEKEQDPLLYQLTLQQNIDDERVKIILPDGSDSYNSVSLFSRLCQLRRKRDEISNRANNDPEVEKGFRKTCSLYERNASDFLLNSQTYEEYINAYQKTAAIYLVAQTHAWTTLFIYDTETESEMFWFFKLQHHLVNCEELIFLLPNGEFLIAWKGWWNKAFIVDRNYELRQLSVEMPKKMSTAIYYNKIVYCFAKKSSYSSLRFNLDKDRWSKLPWAEELNDDWCNSIIFKGNILISGHDNCNLLLFSIDLDSFSIIPYEFKTNEGKILINAEDRLYLIESNGWIYESEIANEYAWKQIGKSIISYDPIKVNCSYNKGGIYIAIDNFHFRQYLKFDLHKKVLIEVAFYSEYLGLKKTGDKLEAINWCPCNSQTFKIDPDHAAAYIDKGYTLYYIGKELDEIERHSNKHWEDAEDYFKRGNALRNLERYHDAKNCYEKAIKLNSEHAEAYLNNGITLHHLGQNSKAIQCYNKSLKLRPKNADVYYNKGVALIDMGDEFNAMRCFNDAIKISPNNTFRCFCYRAELFNNLGQEVEAYQDFNKAWNLFYENIYRHFNSTFNEEYMELLGMLCTLQKQTIEFKKELQELKDASLKNQKMLKMINEKEVVVKEKHSKLLKRAVDSHACLDRISIKSSEAIEQIKKEILEHQNSIIDIANQLSILLSIGK